jgi:hypothetical protein
MMNYLVKKSFATVGRAFCEGELVTDVDDADKLVQAGLLEAVEENKQPVELPAPEQKTKRGKK